MPGPGGFAGFGSTPQSSGDDQTAGNLVTVQAYGIATLYEKFEKAPAKKDDGTAGTGTGSTPPMGGPAPMTPMGGPAPMTPMGVPMPTAPMTPAPPPKM